MILPSQRHLFDIPPDRHYLDCAKMSPLLLAAVEAGHAGLMRKAHPWTIEAPDFFAVSEEVRALFARMIGASADDIAIIPAASYGLAVAGFNARVERGQTIVTLAEDFPSTTYMCRELAQHSGGELLVVERPGDGDWTAAILEAIDGRTAMVCTPNVHWICGGLIDLLAVSRRCREVGASLVLDTTQSTGALPIDVKAIDPDYLIAASYKWLLGPYSVGFLYVAKRNQQGRPIEQSWLVREGASDFRRLINYRDELISSARRFDVGERENFALLPVAKVALEQLLEWGVDNISETLGAMTGRIVERFASRDDLLPPLSNRAPHYLSIRFRNGLPDDIGEQLARRKVHVSLRGDGIRITPHLYNDDDDIEALAESLI